MELQRFRVGLAAERPVLWHTILIFFRINKKYLIHIFSGIATAGINLSLTNIGLKLAPKEEAIPCLDTHPDSYRDNTQIYSLYLV